MIVVVADDLSGAAEIASIAVAANLSAEIRTDLADLDFTFDAESAPDVVVFDSATRSDRPATAYAKLRSFASQPLFKKVDSVLRGVILAELTALSERGALLLAANPSRGRVIRDGRYYVRDVPLDETVFAADPEYPARTADVRELLLDRASAPSDTLSPTPGQSASELTWLPVHSVPVDSPFPQSGLAVPDVETHEQLVARLHEWDGRGIVAGAADCFVAWLELLTNSRPISLRPFALSPRTESPRRVFVCGSHAAWISGRASQCGAGRIPVIVLPEASTEMLASPLGQAWLDDAADQLAERGSLMLALGDRNRSGAADDVDASHRWRPNELADQLAAAARALADRVPIGQWFLEGGATASAVVRRFGWSRLTALPMLAPGVTPLRPALPASVNAASGVRSGDTTPIVVVKPGSYDWPESVWQS